MRGLQYRITYHHAAFRGLALATLMIGMTLPTLAEAAPTSIHLTQKNGYFEAQEVLTNLQSGEYEFVVSNASGKNVGFQIQKIEGGKTLVLGLLKVGETKSFKTHLENGDHRYRCPINPTPWYEFGVGR